jgi:hypothetical protein
MNSMPFAAPITRHRAIKSILLGGFLAGVLDGLDAVVFFGLTMGATAVRIFQYIAAGLIGPVSYQGGWRTVALGVLLHFTVATGSATVYYLASLELPGLVRKPLTFGPIFGLVVYIVMYYVIVPQSAVPKTTRPFSALELANELVAHMFFVGLPIALAAKWADRRNEDVPSSHI